MAINIKKYLLLAIILFVFSPFLPAQNAGYYIEDNGDEIKYIQRFAWRGGEYALYYEVIFEREINGAFSPYLRETTTSQFIELSLPPGAYRFCVIPYDILGKPAEGSPWTNIQIFAVPQPEQPEEPEPEPEPELAFEEPEHEQEKHEPEKPEPEKTVLFRIGAELGYRLPVYGNKYFGDSGDPYVGLRTSILFKIPLDIYIGAEFTGDVNRYGNIEYWRLYFYTFGFNLLAEKWSPKKILGVGLRMGVLYPSINILQNWYDIPEEQRQYFKEGQINIIAAERGFYAERLSPNIGVSFYWLIKKRLLLDVGLNFIHQFSITDNHPPSGFFCPVLGISYQF